MNRAMVVSMLIVVATFSGCFVSLNEGLVKDKRMEISSPATMNMFETRSIVFNQRYFLIVCDENGHCDQWQVREFEYKNIRLGDRVQRP